MGKSTISMAIFNSFLYVYQRINTKIPSAFPSLVQISRMFPRMTTQHQARSGVSSTPRSLRAEVEKVGAPNKVG